MRPHPGQLIVELDHDDRLLPRCLEYVVRASFDHPDAGFFYSDGAEVFENGENAHYADGWGFGYGSYRTEQIDGAERMVQNYPPVNAKTIRHIIGPLTEARDGSKLHVRRAGERRCLPPRNPPPLSEEARPCLTRPPFRSPPCTSWHGRTR